MFSAYINRETQEVLGARPKTSAVEVMLVVRTVKYNLARFKVLVKHKHSTTLAIFIFPTTLLSFKSFSFKKQIFFGRYIYV